MLVYIQVKLLGVSSVSNGRNTFSSRGEIGGFRGLILRLLAPDNILSVVEEPIDAMSHTTFEKITFASLGEEVCSRSKRGRANRARRQQVIGNLRQPWRGC